VSSALLLSLALLLLNSFFVAAEFAVIAARRSQVEPAAQAGRRSARTALWALEHVPLMLAGSQLGITVCSLGLGAVAEPAVVRVIEGPFDRLGMPDGLLHPVAFGLGLAVVVYLHVVIGEMVPKNLTLAGPDRAVLILAPPLVAFSRVFALLIRAVNAITALVLRAVGVQVRAEVTSAFTAAEVHTIVTESQREGLLADQHGLITGALEFSDRLAADVMVPLAELVTVPEGCTPAQVERLVARTGFSRFPVMHEGEVAGYLHLKDLLYAEESGRYDSPVSDKRIRSLVSVGAADEVEDALAAMQRAGSHLARVVGGDGSTAGVVFLEDVLEQLVGEVRDATQRNGQRGS
jgi:CBS domain containing-hemolysin-like protein